MRPVRLGWMVVVVVIAAGCADAPGAGPGEGAGWHLTLTAGTEGNGPDSYWDARMAISEEGILILANSTTEPDTGYNTWFSEDGATWEEGRLDPPGRFDSLYVSVLVDTPGKFLVAGIASTDIEGDQEVAIWETDGRVWERIDEPTGLASVVDGFLRPMCICGSLNDVVAVDSGFLGVGQDDRGDSVVWQSSDEESWELSTIGPGDGGGGLVAATQLGSEVFAAGMAPGIAVWHLEGGRWAPIAVGDAFGLPAVPVGTNMDDNEEFHDAVIAAQVLGLTVHNDSLYSLLDFAVQFGEDSCDGLVSECNHKTLGLFWSSDGLTWDRLPLPDAMRWNDHGGRIGSLDGRLYIVETGGGVLQVWSTDDPAIDVEAKPEPDSRFDEFTATRSALDDEVGGFSALDLVSTATPGNLDEPMTIGLRGRQTEVTLVLDIADEYVLEGDVLMPVGETRPVALPYEEEHFISLDLTSVNFGPGLHEFLLAIPAWINPAGTPEGDPVGAVVLTISVNHFDEARAAEAAAFCDTAVPLVDGQVPTTGDFERLVSLTPPLTYPELTTALLDAVEKVKTEISRPIDQGYNTGPLVQAVADICGRYDMFSVSAIS